MEKLLWSEYWVPWSNPIRSCPFIDTSITLIWAHRTRCRWMSNRITTPSSTVYWLWTVIFPSSWCSIQSDSSSDTCHLSSAACQYAHTLSRVWTCPCCGSNCGTCSSHSASCLGGDRRKSYWGPKLLNF